MSQEKLQTIQNMGGGGRGVKEVYYRIFASGEYNLMN